MGATGLTQPQPLGLRHLEVNPVQGHVVVQVNVPDAETLVELLDVAGEPDRFPGDDGVDNGFLAGVELHRKVPVGSATSINGVCSWT